MVNGSRDFVEQVRSRSDIVEIIGAEVALRPSGSVLKGLSPFNRETDPSFVVWPKTQSWHDFSNGGGRGGDVFSYLMERQSLGFKEALHELARRAGLKRPGQDDEEYTRELACIAERREIERLLTQAAAHYHRALPSKIRAQLFRDHYGFTEETIDRLQLGWADGHLFDFFHDHLGLNRAAALKTGLFVQAPSGGVHDFFQHRLVFPYWKQGKVVYFIARRTEYTGDEDWERPKYKKQITHSDQHPYVSAVVGNDFFYNEDAGRGADEILVTEGVTDCISAMQVGIRCISPVTTRFREQDVPKLLSLTRSAKRVIVCNDAEASGAGEAGALDTAAALSREGRDVRIATLPRPEGAEKVDLNDFLKARPVEEVRGILAKARRYPEHLLGRIPTDATPADLERQLKPLLAAVARCQPIERDAYVADIAKRFGVKVSTVKELLKGAKQPDAAPNLAAAKSSRFTIELGRQLRDTVAEAWAAIQARNCPPATFTRSGSLVRVARDENGSRIETLDEAAVLELLGEVADWVTVTQMGTRNEYPPRDVTRVVHARAKGLPILQAILTAPVFTSSGRLLRESGYHAEACAWLDLPAGLQVPQVSAVPTDVEVAAARALLVDELLGDFPFVDASDRAHMLALLLLPFARRLIPGLTPIHLVEAPEAGSGKGLLVALVGVLSSGTAASGGSIPDNDEEVRKKITSELASGHLLLVLDNADEKKRLDSAALASALTMPVWKDRLLGQTRMIAVPNQVVWILTGNNPRLSTELARRCIRVRIDPRVDRPWLRSRFRHPALIDWALENRGPLVHACLTLIQNWVVRGRPPAGTRLGSFERWSETIGGILAAGSVPGFLGNLESLYETADTEGGMWREFILVWWSTHREAPVRVADLAQLCTAGNLMEPVLGEGSEKSQHIRLGRALQRVRDRVFGDHRVESVPDPHTKRPVYRLAKVTPESTS